MATIRKLRDKWPAMVRRKGIAPRSKSFDKKTDAEKWARDLEAPAWGSKPSARQSPDTPACLQYQPSEGGLAENSAYINMLSRLRDCRGGSVAACCGDDVSGTNQPHWQPQNELDRVVLKAIHMLWMWLVVCSQAFLR